MTGVYRRVGDTLIPAGDTALAAVRSVKDGALCMAAVWVARNPEQHNLYHKLCEIVAENLDRDKDEVRKWITMKLGFADYWFEPDTGKLHLDPKSIAHESMGQEEFNRLFIASVRLMAELMQNAPAELLARFNELVDPAQRMPKRLRKGRNGRLGSGEPADGEAAPAANVGG